MDQFGTLTIRLYIVLPIGNQSRSKACVLHRYHGRKQECLVSYAKWLRLNGRIDGAHATWEVREAIHPEDLPSVLHDEPEAI